jgi:hypothetical protein
MLTYFQRDNHGHFAVVRPVGHSGNLVQVIDPFEEPRVLDEKTLREADGWTGFVLVPYRPPWKSWLIVATTLLLGTALIAPALRKRVSPRGR